jgi:hypothetical protein
MPHRPVTVRIKHIDRQRPLSILVVIADLWGTVARMRLSSSEAVVAAAEEIVRQAIEAYAAPNQTFNDLRQSAQARGFRDPLRNFSEACRAELLAARP